MEDDHSLRDLISFLLTDNDYDVEAFANATSFEKKIKDSYPDLILMDIMLPDGNGVKLCEALKQNEDKKEIPVLLMSAHADPKIANESGACDFLKKPFDIDELYSCVQKYVS